MQTLRLAEQIIIKGPIHPNYKQSYFISSLWWNLTSQIVLVLFVQVLSSLSEISASTEHSADHSVCDADSIIRHLK